jgi:hypothetical protein
VIKAVGCTCLIDIRLQSVKDIKTINSMFSFLFLESNFSILLQMPEYTLLTMSTLRYLSRHYLSMTCAQQKMKSFVICVTYLYASTEAAISDVAIKLSCLPNGRTDVIRKEILK